jgi:hypothetical protein
VAAMRDHTTTAALVINMLTGGKPAPQTPASRALAIPTCKTGWSVVRGWRPYLTTRRAFYPVATVCSDPKPAAAVADTGSV